MRTGRPLTEVSKGGAVSAVGGQSRRIELLRSIAHERNAAVLLVTHDAEAAALADRRCTMRDGKLLNGHPGSDQDDPLSPDPLSHDPRAPTARP